MVSLKWEQLYGHCAGGTCRRCNFGYVEITNPSKEGFIYYYCNNCMSDLDPEDIIPLGHAWYPERKGLGRKKK